MKNKLLITTALSSLALAGIAQAETKVTGGMTLSYMAQSHTTASSSRDNFGRETQIDVSNSGDLNNGMKYAAGFSIEFDGNDTSSSTVSNENVYIDFISGNTTISLSADHGLNTDSTAVPRISVPANSSGASGLAFTQGATVGNNAQHVKEGMGVFLAQKTNGGTIQVRKIRALVDAGGNDNGIKTSTAGGAWDAIFVGDLGVKGLGVNLQYAKAEKSGSSSTTSTRDSVGTLLSASYNSGAVTVGAGRRKGEHGAGTTDYTGTDVGVVFAANDQISVGLNYAKTDITGAAEDEKITGVQLGYNLGAVAISLGYNDITGVGGAANTDSKVGFVRVATKF